MDSTFPEVVFELIVVNKFCRINRAGAQDVLNLKFNDMYPVPSFIFRNINDSNANSYL